MPSFKKILVPVDFSSHSARALEAGIDCAKLHGAELCIAHVEQPVVAPVHVPYMPPLLGLDAVAAMARTRCEEQLREAGERARGAGVACVSTELLEGLPWREIVALAARDAFDLIVMGTHGRSGLHRALMGSVAELVVRKAPCAVLTVRDHGSAVEDVAAHAAGL